MFRRVDVQKGWRSKGLTFKWMEFVIRSTYAQLNERREGKGKKKGGGKVVKEKEKK